MIISVTSAGCLFSHPAQFHVLSVGIERAQSNAESVREFQPRVCFETLGIKLASNSVATLKGLRHGPRFVNQRRNPFRVASNTNLRSTPGLPKRNPGLKFANALSVSCVALRGNRNG